MNKLRSINRKLDKAFTIIFEGMVFTMFATIGVLGIAALILLIGIAIQTTVDLF